jgi:hypothetical protein
MTKRKLILLISLLLPTFITACSFKTLYNNLDYLIPEYIIEGMVSLDDVLEEKLELRTEAFLKWHRETQLIQYANWLKTIQQIAGPTLTEEQVTQRIKEMDLFWSSLSIKLNDEVSNLLPHLDESQRDELFNSIRYKNEIFRGKYIDMDEEERKEYYSERLLETYETWIGKLTDEQEHEIVLSANKQVDTAELRLQRRLDWQEGITQILNNNLSIEEKTQRLHNFMSEFETTNTPGLREKLDYNQRIFSKLTVKISHSMSKDQMEFFIDKTDGYIRMFTELAESR